MSNSIDIHLLAATNLDGELEKLTYRAVDLQDCEHFVTDDLDFEEFHEEHFDSAFTRLAAKHENVQELFISVNESAAREIFETELGTTEPDSREQIFSVMETLKNSLHWGRLIPGVLVADVRA